MTWVAFRWSGSGWLNRCKLHKRVGFWWDPGGKTRRKKTMSTIPSSLNHRANAVRSAVKAKFGVSDNIRNRKWVDEVASLTNKVQNSLEVFLDRSTEGLELTNEGFVAWVHSEEVDEHANPLLVGLYEAYAAAVACSEGVDWIQEQCEGLEEQADKLEERGTDRAAEKADQLRELKDELVEIAHTMECNQAGGSDAMIEAIEAGDMEEVGNVINEGEFLLDI